MSTLPNAIAFETYPAEEIEGTVYYLYPSGQAPVEETVVYAPTVDGTVQFYAPYGLPPEAYGQQSSAVNPVLLGCLVAVGTALIMAGVQKLITHIKKKKAAAKAGVLEPVAPHPAAVSAEGEAIVTPVAGIVKHHIAQPGQMVQKGQLLCVIETRLTAPKSGVLTQITVPEEAAAATDAPLFVIREEKPQ